MNVSNAPGLEAEAAVAIDPTDDQLLLAGSNTLSSARADSFARAYVSTDGGATWRSDPAPAAVDVGGKRRCNFGDPAVAIDRASREYFGFLAAPCPGDLHEPTRETEQLPPVTLQIGSRSGPTGAWRTVAVFPPRVPRLDDKPSLAVDTSQASPHVDRVYLAWTRVKLRTPGKLTAAARIQIVVSRSDDGGSTWSLPVPVSDRDDVNLTFSSIAIDRSGTVFVTWMDNFRDIWIDRSTDGGDHFGADTRVDGAVSHRRVRCGTFAAAVAIPAQNRRCITATPLVTVDDRERAPERVYVTYGAPGDDGVTQDVFVVAFDGSLRPLLGAPAGTRKQVNPNDGEVRSDQFMSTAAVDPASGRLWVCFYDTTGDRRRERVFYTCTASADGGASWARPLRAATVASNASVGAAPRFQLGDYAGLAVANGAAHPIWTDTRNLKTTGEDIYTTLFTDALLASG